MIRENVIIFALIYIQIDRNQYKKKGFYKKLQKKDAKIIQIIKIAFSIQTMENIWYLNLATKIYITYNSSNFEKFFNKLFFSDYK